MQVLEGQGQKTSSAREYAAFAALALLAGPLRGLVGDAFSSAVNMQVSAGNSLCGVIAGAVLVGIAAMRQEKMLRARHWKAICLLLLPQGLLSVLGSVEQSTSLLHGIGWGTALLLAVAAPLWLALLAAFGVAQLIIPRKVAGAALAGIFAVCLVVPTEAYGIMWNQVPALALQGVLSIAIVATWAIAAPQLAGSSALMLAGCYVLLNSVLQAALSLMFERRAWQTLDWNSLGLPLLLNVMLTACLWWVWFWLLQRLPLAAFSMGALAAWVAGLISGILGVGWANWRLDLALMVAAGAVVIALGAREADEQPTALGLGGT